MVAILGGLGAAVCWAGATLSASRSSRMISPSSVLAWVMLTGLVITLPLLMLSGIPAGLGWGSGGWLVATGASNVVGLLFVYAALRTGKVGVVAPISSTEGSMAAIIAVLLGERIAPAAGALLLVIAAGITLSAVTRDTGHEGLHAPNRRAALLALSAALCFGLSLYAGGRAGQELPVAWVLLPARLAGVLGVALPLLLTRRLQLTRPALPLVLASGVFEVLGLSAYVLGARDGIAITAVVSSQFAAISALAALVLFRERLVPIQYGGLAVIAMGVAALAVVGSR
ncbi:MAG: DMT family transporter [Tepidiformaceae bacterium]